MWTCTNFYCFPCRRKVVITSRPDQDTSLSRYMRRVESPIRPVMLPYWAENNAQELALAPSPDQAERVLSSINRSAEVYFDLSASVESMDLSYELDDHRLD